MWMAHVAKLSALGAVLAATAATADAQKTWIVDAQRGPGYDHAEIAPAIAAASEGDAIVVRAGSYAFPRSVIKAVRILGEPGAILDLGPLANPFTVSAIGAGKTAGAIGKLRGIWDGLRGRQVTAPAPRRGESS